MAQVLQHFYFYFDEVGSLSSSTTLFLVARLNKALAIEHRQNEPSDILHCNHRVCGNHYQKT